MLFQVACPPYVTSLIRYLTQVLLLNIHFRYIVWQVILCVDGHRTHVMMWMSGHLCSDKRLKETYYRIMELKISEAAN